MLVKYKGQTYEMIDELEPGEMELDMLTDSEELEDTVEFSNDFLEQTTQLHRLKNSEIDGEVYHEQ